MQRMHLLGQIWPAWSLAAWLGTYLPALLVAALLFRRIFFARSSVQLGEEERDLSDWTFIFRAFVSSDDVEELAEEELSEQSAKVTGIQEEEQPPLLADDKSHHGRFRPSLAVTLGLTIIGLIEAFVWIAILAYSLVARSHSPISAVTASIALLAWIYAALCPIFRPTSTPPYDLLAIYGLHMVAHLLSVYELCRGYVYHTPPSMADIVAVGVNLVLCVAAVSLIASMPMSPHNSRSTQTAGDYPPPGEDNVSLYDWITFRWVNELINKGSRMTMEDKDVYDLPAYMQSRMLLKRFHIVTPVIKSSAAEEAAPKITLLRRVWRANAQDLTLDFVFALVSGVLAYQGPFFLKKILDAIASSSTNQGHGTTRETAYQYAFLAFAIALLKSQIDLQRLFISRRACVRIRSELVMLIYDKSLRRRDFRGTLAAPSADKADDKTAQPEGSKKAAPPQAEAAADLGKVVSLMSVDAQRVAFAASAMNMVYAAPIEIVVASTFLFNLLGPSALVGYLCIFISTPLQTMLAKRAMKLYRSMSTARDKRMSILTEVIAGLKFLKYFGTIHQWSDRVLAARETELGWNLKLQINQSYFMMIMTLTPALFAMACFTSYTVWFGNELDAATGFTAIALFGMVRGPLNILPGFITQILNTHVCLKRIEKFLDEDEVPDWVCTGRTDVRSATIETFDRRILCEDATFRWAKSEASTPSAIANKNVPTASLLVKVAQRLRLIKSAGDAATPTTTESHVDESPATSNPHDSLSFQLQNVTINPPVGKMTLVAGPTGCGKSTLLASLLGEVSLVSGRLQLPKNPGIIDPETGLAGTIAYCAQQPWLLQASIKDNVVFGSAFDERRYLDVLECCALNPDLEILVDGDRTEIGERGITLSGGQKARVALARAVYSRSATVLMDDVLAAVDSHTAEKITRECLNGPLMQGRTVLLVTHHINLVLPGCAWVILLDNGNVVAEGTVTQLRESGKLEALATMVEQAEEETDDVAAAVDVEDSAKQEADLSGSASNNKPAEPAVKLVKDEQKATGAVKLSVYDLWLRAASYWSVALILALLMLFKLNDLGEKLWLSFWTSSYEHPGLNANTTMFGSILDLMPSKEVPLYARLVFPPANEHVWPYILGFLLIQLFSAVIWIVLAIFSYLAVIRAGRTLFAQLLNAIVRATSRYLDQTTSGRLTNVFARDLDTIDGSLQGSLQQAVASLVNLAFSLGAIAFLVPAFAIVGAGVALIYYQVGKGYIAVGRDLRRIESVTRSPIFSSFGELLDGVMTVRAYSQESRFLTITEKRQDRTSAAHYYTWMTSRWLLLRYDCLGAVCVLTVSVLALSGSIPAGLAGIAITQALALTQAVYWLSRNYAQLEQDGNSLERIADAVKSTPQEPPAVIEGSRPPAFWPSEGGIDIKDLEIRYAPELAPVLHGISLSIRPREKIGIVGRTGSGKSTLALAFFRFVEYARGSIVIDGVDVSKMGLDDLRGRLVIIPQDAVLFSGTIRDNLDPFNEHTDEDCIHALRQVQLYSTPPTIGEPAEGSAIGTAVEGTGETTAVGSGTQTPRPQQASLSLDTVVADAGGNFSAGQRQLLAVARAMLRKSRVVICDEMSSAIDFQTDTILQRTMSEAFEDSTVLTIAHRLSTVASTSDRVLVLDRGNVVEFDSPHTLLEDEGSVFYGMCKKSGELESLKKAAADKASKL